MTKVGLVHVRNCLFCDDIRIDNYGKYLLIGVTPGGFTAEGFPASVPMALYFDFDVAEAGEYELFLRLSGPGKGSGTMKLVLGVTEPAEIATVITPRIELLLEEPGIFLVDISNDQANWQNVLTKVVAEAPGGPFPPKMQLPDSVAGAQQ